MSKNDWEVLITDMPHRQDLLAEIWIKGEQWAEVYMSKGKPIIEVYPHPSADAWEFDYADLSAILENVNRFVESMTFKHES